MSWVEMWTWTAILGAVPEEYLPLVNKGKLDKYLGRYACQKKITCLPRYLGMSQLQPQDCESLGNCLFITFRFPY